MKQVIILFLMLLLLHPILPLNAQKNVEEILDKMDSYIFEKKYDYASNLLKEIMSNYENEPDIYYQANYYIGKIHYLKNEYHYAEEYFLKLINEENKIPNECLLSRLGIICDYLIKIYLKKKDYDKALYYTEVLKSKYLNLSSCKCANCYYTKRLNLALKYAKCYLGLNRINEAINVLYPYIFYNGLADNKKAIDLAINLYLEKYSIFQMRDELIQAEKNIYTRISTYKDHTYVKYYICLFDDELELPALHYHTLYVIKKNKNKRKNEKLEIIGSDSPEFFKIVREKFKESKLYQTFVK